MGLTRISALNLPFVNAHPFILASATVALALTFFAYQAVAQNPVVKGVADCAGFIQQNLNRANSAAEGSANTSAAPAPLIQGFQAVQRFADNYGFYALKQGPGVFQTAAGTLADLFVDEQHSIGGLMDGAVNGLFSGGLGWNNGKRWDMHAHLPPNPTPEELDFIFRTATERNVELLAVTSYGIGGAEAETYEGFIDAAKNSGNYVVEERGFLTVLRQGEMQLVLLRAQEISTRQGFHVLIYGGSRRLDHKINVEDVLSQADRDDIKIKAHTYLDDLIVNGHHIGMSVPMSAENERYVYVLLESGRLDGVEVANPFAPMPLNVFARQLADRARVARKNNNHVPFITGGSDAHFYTSDRTLGSVLGLTGIVVKPGIVDFSSWESFAETFAYAQRIGAVTPYSRFNSARVLGTYMRFPLELCQKGIAEANAKRSP